MVIFENAPGVVAAIDGPARQLEIAPLVAVDPAISWQATQSIITGIGLSSATSHSISHAVGGDIHVYVFGDRIGQAQISGLCFFRDCEQSSDLARGTDGFQSMLQWFNENKLSARESPVRIQFGRQTLRALLVGANYNNADPKNWIVQYSLSLLLLPSRERTQ